MSKLAENSRNLSLDLTRTVAILLVTVVVCWTSITTRMDGFFMYTVPLFIVEFLCSSWFPVHYSCKSHVAPNCSLQSDLHAY